MIIGALEELDNLQLLDQPPKTKEKKRTSLLPLMKSFKEGPYLETKIEIALA